MGRKSKTEKRYTIKDIRNALNYQLSHTDIHKLSNVSPTNRKPIIVEGKDWYETKLGNIFYKESALKKLQEYLSEKEIVGKNKFNR